MRVCPTQARRLPDVDAAETSGAFDVSGVTGVWESGFELVSAGRGDPSGAERSRPGLAACVEEDEV